MPNGTIGLFHKVENRDGVVAGRQVAEDNFLASLSAYGKQYSYALFLPGRQLNMARRSFAYDGVSVHDQRMLSDPLRVQGFAAWHATSLEPYAPFSLRARAEAAFPITFVHHTISYKTLLHEAILPLLLSDNKPSDAIICTSTAARTALKNLIDQVADQFNAEHGTQLAFRGRLEQIPLAVDTERFRPLEKAAARNFFGLDPEAFVILWLGRLSIVDKADLLPLIQAFATLQQANLGRKLTLLCAGTQRPGEQFGDIVESYARHLGVGNEVKVLSDRDTFMAWLPQLYSASDAFVSPADNIQETFGLTVIEAMACGVPQVVSDWNGYKDTVVDGETGFRLPTYWAACDGDLDGLLTSSPYDHLAMAQSVAVDMRAFVTALQALMDNPALRTRMAEASRKRALARYDWGGVIAQYEQLWLELGQEAEADRTPVSDKTRYARPRYTEVFGHYATSLLSDQTELRLSALGRQLLHEQSPLPTHFNAEWQYLEVDLIKRILLGFGKMDAAGKPLSVGRICAVLTRQQPDAIARPLILRHVLWLMKYGFVEP